jgi:hypothetical protein
MSDDIAPIGPNEIEAVLFADGLALADYFLVDGMPMFWGKLGGIISPWAQVIEDNALGCACVEYLRERRVNEYASLADVPPPPAEA